MELPVEDFSAYRAVDKFGDLIGPGSRILRLAPERMPLAPLVVGGGEPRLRFGDRPSVPVELRCAKVDRALCLRGGVILDLDTGRVLPDIFRKPPAILPPSADVDPTRLGIDNPPDDWELVPARQEKGPAIYADSRHLGYGHVLLEGLSRCWPLVQAPTPPVLLVAHKAAGLLYWRWFEALGVRRGWLRSTRSEPLRVDNLIVPSQAYVLDRGMSPRFHQVTRRIAQRLGTAKGSPRLFVSRRDAPKRRLVNEAEIERAFRARGFRIFHPEEHTIEEQVRAFAGASVVAGPVGSAMYSVAFSPATTKTLVLAPDEFYTLNDRILAAGREHSPVYAFGRSEGHGRQEGMLRDWHLDQAVALSALERALSGG